MRDFAPICINMEIDTREITKSFSRRTAYLLCAERVRPIFHTLSSFLHVLQGLLRNFTVVCSFRRIPRCSVRSVHRLRKMHSSLSTHGRSPIYTKSCIERLQEFDIIDSTLPNRNYSTALTFKQDRRYVKDIFFEFFPSTL